MRPLRLLTSAATFHKRTSNPNSRPVAGSRRPIPTGGYRLPAFPICQALRPLASLPLLTGENWVPYKKSLREIIVTADVRRLIPLEPGASDLPSNRGIQPSPDPGVRGISAALDNAQPDDNQRRLPQNVGGHSSLPVLQTSRSGVSVTDGSWSQAQCFKPGTGDQEIASRRLCRGTSDGSALAFAICLPSQSTLPVICARA